jgi:hypothetical protein
MIKLLTPERLLASYWCSMVCRVRLKVAGSCRLAVSNVIFLLLKKHVMLFMI